MPYALATLPRGILVKTPPPDKILNMNQNIPEKGKYDTDDRFIPAIFVCFPPLPPLLS